MYLASLLPNRKLNKNETAGACNIPCQMVNACTVLIGRAQLWRSLRNLKQGTILKCILQKHYEGVEWVEQGSG
jgi:hypothetical protein